MECCSYSMDYRRQEEQVVCIRLLEGRSRRTHRSCISTLSRKGCYRRITGKGWVGITFQPEKTISLCFHHLHPLFFRRLIDGSFQTISRLGDIFYSSENRIS